MVRKQKPVGWQRDHIPHSIAAKKGHIKKRARLRNIRLSDFDEVINMYKNTVKNLNGAQRMAVMSREAFIKAKRIRDKQGEELAIKNLALAIQIFDAYLRKSE